MNKLKPYLQGLALLIAICFIALVIHSAQQSAQKNSSQRTKIKTIDKNLQKKQKEKEQLDQSQETVKEDKEKQLDVQIEELKKQIAELEARQDLDTIDFTLARDDPYMQSSKAWLSLSGYIEMSFLEDEDEEGDSKKESDQK